jgi:hypothetical protein
VVPGAEDRQQYEETADDEADQVDVGHSCVRGCLTGQVDVRDVRDTGV